MKVSTNFRCCSFKASNCISRITTQSKIITTGCYGPRKFSTFQGHSLDTTITRRLDIHHTILTNTNFTKHPLVFSRHYADPKDKKKADSKEKDSKAAPAAESKDAKKDAKKDEKKGGKKKVETGPKRVFDLYNLFKDKPMSKTPPEKVPQWFIDMAVQFNAGTLGKNMEINYRDFRSVKRYIRKMNKKKINENNKNSIVSSGEGDADYEEDLPIPKKRITAGVNPQQQ
mmetsp:Transcript_27483/g.38761  ORF Transcript_27483/g.38761 Transcript_27483/m.38761 type:complete len:228 (-) Transcript_27483:963-1646(-)